MTAPRIQPEEQRRLAALYQHHILDTPAERAFDDLAQLAAGVTGRRLGFICFADHDRHWIKALAAADGGCAHAEASPLISRPCPVLDGMLRLDLHGEATGAALAASGCGPFLEALGAEAGGGLVGVPLVGDDKHVLGAVCVTGVEPGSSPDGGAAADRLRPVARMVLDAMRLRRHVAEECTVRDALARHRTDLQREVETRTRQLVKTREEIVRCLARAAEYRDDDTGSHVKRVSLYVLSLCRALGLPPERCRMIALASTLHDVGKIGVPDAILLKPGKLTAAEFTLMQEHVVYGREIIENLSDNDDDIGFQAVARPEEANRADVELLDVAARIAETHHEKFDGTGYPHGLSGRDIPLVGRIVAVADVFDALCSARPYKPAFPLNEAARIIRDSSGTHFDPELVAAFDACFGELCAIRETHCDPETDADCDDTNDAPAVRRAA